MCKCTQTDGYVQAMQNAKSVEKKTGVEQAVFIQNGISYFGKREDVAKQEGICCYILTSGEEIQIENPKPSNEDAINAAKKQVEDFEKGYSDKPKTADEAIEEIKNGIDGELDKIDKSKKDSKAEPKKQS